MTYRSMYMVLVLSIKILVNLLIMAILFVPYLLTQFFIGIAMIFKKMRSIGGFLVTGLIAMYLSASFFGYAIIRGGYDFAPEMLLAPFKVNIFAPETADMVTKPFLLLVIPIMIALYAVFGGIWYLVEHGSNHRLKYAFLHAKDRIEEAVRDIKVGGDRSRYYKRQMEKHKLSDRYIDLG